MKVLSGLPLALLFVLMAAMRLCHAAPQFPVTVVDARGVAVTLRAAPHKIISLTPGATEMLFALGLGNSVIGDTDYCDYPPAAKTKAKIGNVTIRDEQVIRLQPDLIVGDVVAEKGAVQRLAALHQPLFAIAPTSLVTVEQTLRLLGRITGTNTQAARVVAEMEKKRQAATALISHDLKRPKVLIVIGVNPLWTAGRGTFIADVVQQAGGVNLASAIEQYAPYSKEKVLANPPDFILASPADRAAFYRDPVLRALAAAQSNRFFFVTDENLLMRPGPRLADGLLQVAQALHTRPK